MDHFSKVPVRNRSIDSVESAVFRIVGTIALGVGVWLYAQSLGEEKIFFATVMAGCAVALLYFGVRFLYPNLGNEHLKVLLLEVAGLVLAFFALRSAYAQAWPLMFVLLVLASVCLFFGPFGLLNRSR